MHIVNPENSSTHSSAGGASNTFTRSDVFMRELFPFLKEAMVTAHDMYMVAEEHEWSILERQTATSQRRSGESSWDDIERVLSQCMEARSAYVDFLEGLQKLASLTFTMLAEVRQQSVPTFGRFSELQREALRQILHGFDSDAFEAISLSTFSNLEVPLQLKRCLLNCVTGQRNATGRLLKEAYKIAEAEGRFGRVARMHQMYTQLLTTDITESLCRVDCRRLDVIEQQHSIADVLESAGSEEQKNLALIKLSSKAFDGMSSSTVLLTSIFDGTKDLHADIEFSGVEGSSAAMIKRMRTEQRALLAIAERDRESIEDREILCAETPSGAYPRFISCCAQNGDMRVVATICQPRFDGEGTITQEGIVWARALARCIADLT